MFMMEHIECVGLKIYNIFPLINSLIPGHVKFDTTATLFLLFKNHHGNVSDYVRHGNLKNYQLEIWSMFFKTELKCFHMGDDHKYIFHHMIETDGVSCSIILRHEKYKNQASFFCLCYCIFIYISIILLTINIYRNLSQRNLLRRKSI